MRLAPSILLYLVLVCPGNQAAAAPAPPLFANTTLQAVEVRTVDRSYSNVEILSLSSPTGVHLRVGRDMISFPVANLVRVVLASQRDKRRPYLSPGTVRWTLAGGDRLGGSVISAEKGAVSIQETHLGILSLPLETIAALEVAQPTSFQKSAAWVSRMPLAGDDVVLLTNGDVLRGFLSEITSDGLIWDSEAGSSTIPFRMVVAARLATVAAPAGAKPGDALRTRVEFTGGERVTLTDFRIVEGAASGRAPFGGSISFDAKTITALEVEGGRWAWLDEIEPVSASHIPMLNIAWERRPGQSVTGGPLTTANQTYGRGIGVHSKSVLAYEIDGAYEELVTSFGLDDSAGPLADVNVSILLDGQEKFSQAGIRPGRLYGPVRVPLAGGSRLELLVGYGQNGDIQDRFNWLEPGLIRKE